MEAILTPRLKDHRTHVIMFEGNLTEKRKARMVTQLRRNLKLEELSDNEELTKVAINFFHACSRVKDFSCETAKSNDQFWNMTYKNGGSYQEKKLVAIHVWDDSKKRLDDFKDA